MSNSSIEEKLLEDPVADGGPEVAVQKSRIKGKLWPWIAVTLSIILVVAVAGVIALAITLGVEQSKGSGENKEEGAVCLTQECVELSNLVSSGIDDTIDPCEDFYNFSCGNWVQNTQIPTSYLQAGTYEPFRALKLFNRQRLGFALVEMERRDVDALRKLQDLYQSCINTETTNALGMYPLMEVLDRIGGWSVLGNIPSTVLWTLNGEQFLQEKLLNSQAFFSVRVGMDPRNASRYIIIVQNDGLSMTNPESYASEVARQQLRISIANALGVLNPSGDIFLLDDTAAEIVTVEWNLAQIYQNPSSIDPNSIQTTSLRELSLLWPDYNWIERLQVLFSHAGVNDISEDQEIIVYTPLYFAKLSSVLQQFDNTTLENYAKWQVIYPLLKFLGDGYVNAYYTFMLNANPGAEVLTERNDMCIDVLEKVMPIALGRVYAEFILPEGSRATATQMISNIMQAFRERIASRVWLDKKTIERAQRKVDLMKAMVAYPDMIFDDDWLNMLYMRLEVSPENLFDNYYQFLINTVLRNFAQIRKQVDIWTSVPPMGKPTTVNAFNYRTLNQVLILEGIMDVPFFSPNWPLYFQYGALGTILGHEITHGFDSIGRFFNETGQIEAWLSQQSADNFVERQQCFTEQYSQFSLFGIYVNGSFTLAENIADNGGITSAYQAYNNELQRSGESPLTLPGLSYSAQQLYYIAFSQLLCTYTTPQAFQQQVKTDIHSLGPFRVLGTLMNSPEFAEVFQCPVNSRMNPQKKCSLW